MRTRSQLHTHVIGAKATKYQIFFILSKIHLDTGWGIEPHSHAHSRHPSAFSRDVSWFLVIPALVVPLRERSFFHSLHDASCKPPQTHTLTRTLAYVFGCSLRWISVCPSVIRFAHGESQNAFLRSVWLGAALRTIAHAGFAPPSFGLLYAQASTPLLCFRLGALNMQAYSRTVAYMAQWPSFGCSAPLTMQRFALARTFTRE